MIRHPPSRTAGPLYRGGHAPRPAPVRGRVRGGRRARRARRGAGARAHPGGPGRRRNGTGRHPAHLHSPRTGSARRSRRAHAGRGRRLRRHRRGRRALRRRTVAGRPDARAVHRARRPRRRRVVLAGRRPGGLQRRAGAPHHHHRVRCDDAGDARHAGGHSDARPHRSAAEARARPDPVAHRHQQPRAARPCAGRGLALGLAQPPDRPRAQQRPPLAPRRARPGQARPPRGRRARRCRLRRRPRLPGRAGHHHAAAPELRARPARVRGHGLPHDPYAARHARRRARPRAAARRALGRGAGASDERGVRPRDRGPARARPLGGQPAPHPGRLPRHADGQGPGPRRVVALVERLALRRLRRGPRPRGERARRPVAHRAAAAHHRARRRADGRRPGSAETSRGRRQRTSSEPPSGVEHHGDGSVTIDGEPVDDPTRSRATRSPAARPIPTPAAPTPSATATER